MLNFLTSLKSKAILALGAIVGVLLSALRYKSYQMNKQKERYDKERQDRMRELYEKKDEAIDAMVEGLENESKTVERGHFDKE